MSSHPNRQDLPRTPSPRPIPKSKPKKPPISRASKSQHELSKPKDKHEVTTQSKPLKLDLDRPAVSRSYLPDIHQAQFGSQSRTAKNELEIQPKETLREEGMQPKGVKLKLKIPYSDPNGPQLPLKLEFNQGPRNTTASHEPGFKAPTQPQGPYHRPEPRGILPKERMNDSSFIIGLENAASSAAERLRSDTLDLVDQQHQTRPGDLSATEEAERETETNHNFLAVMKALEEYSSHRDQYAPLPIVPTVPSQSYTYDRTKLPNPESQSFQTPYFAGKVPNTNPPPSAEFTPMRFAKPLIPEAYTQRTLTKPPNSTASAQTKFPPPSHFAEICKPTHITHRVCTHAIVVHSILCMPVGKLCGGHPQKFETNEGVCPRCFAIHVDDLEKTIKEQVDVAVKSAREKASRGALYRAGKEIDDALKEVERLRAVWDWLVENGVKNGSGAGNHLMSENWRAGEGGKDKNVYIGQRVVEAIEDLRIAMGDWVKAGGDEDVVRERIQDILGIGAPGGGGRRG